MPGGGAVRVQSGRRLLRGGPALVRARRTWRPAAARHGARRLWRAAHRGAGFRRARQRPVAAVDGDDGLRCGARDLHRRTRCGGSSGTSADGDPGAHRGGARRRRRAVPARVIRYRADLAARRRPSGWQRADIGRYPARDAGRAGSGGCPGGARWPGACLRDRRGLLRRVSGDAGRRPRGPGSRPSGAGHSGGSGRAGSCRCPGPGTCACRGTGRTGADAARATPLPAGAPDHAACHRRGQPGIRRARRRSDPVAGPWAAAHERGGLRRADRRFRRRRPAGHRRRRAGPPGATARHRGLGCLPGRGAVPRRCPVSRRRRPGRRRAGRHRGHERIRQRRHDHRFPALGTPGPAGPADWPAAAGELRGLPRLRGTRCPGGA